VDVALECAGLPHVLEQALASLAVQGRLALAGICGAPFAVDSFGAVIKREAEIISCLRSPARRARHLDGLLPHGNLELDSVIAPRDHWLRNASDWSPKEVDLHSLRVGRSQTARVWPPRVGESRVASPGLLDWQDRGDHGPA
jgi:hypothetical protein